MAEDNAGGTVENPTVEELKAQLEEANNAKAKAEAKIVDLKKSSSETKDQPAKQEENKADDGLIKKEDVAKMIAEAVKEQAIASQEEQYRENQSQSNSMSISGEDASSSGNSFEKISVKDYDALPQTQKNAYYKESLEKNGELDFI